MSLIVLARKVNLTQRREKKHKIDLPYPIVIDHCRGKGRLRRDVSNYSDWLKFLSV